MPSATSGATVSTACHEHRDRHRLHAAPLLGPALRRRAPPLRHRAPVRGPGDLGHHAAAPRAGPRLRRRRPTRRRACSPPSRTRAPWRPSAPGTRPATSSTSPRTARRRRTTPPSAGCAGSALPYDELYCSYDKVARCREIGIDVLIDDSPENLERAMDVGITAATLLHPWNRELCETEDVICGADWDELAATSRRCSRDRAARAAPGAAAARTCATTCRRSSRTARSPTGAARSAWRGWSTQTLVSFLYHYWFRCEVEGDRARPRHRRRPARLQPRGRAPARRVDDRQGDPGGASAPAQAPPDGRALLQGLSVLQHVRHQDRRRAGAPGQRAPSAPRRAAARARVPGGRQGDREALQGPLPAAPLRPRRLRGGGDAGRRPDRPDRRRRRRGGDADARPGRRSSSA